MDSTKNTSDTTKQRKLLRMLLHTKKCMYKNESDTCGRSGCKSMQYILTHAETCVESIGCDNSCLETRQIIAHWGNCTGDGCALCEPFKMMKVKPPTIIQSDAVESYNKTFDQEIVFSDGSYSDECDSMGSSPIQMTDDEHTDAANCKLQTCDAANCIASDSRDVSNSDTSDEDVSSQRSLDKECAEKATSNSWAHFTDMMNELASKANHVDQVHSNYTESVESDAYFDERFFFSFRATLGIRPMGIHECRRIICSDSTRSTTNVTGHIGPYLLGIFATT